jgi:hypothetical protein
MQVFCESKRMAKYFVAKVKEKTMANKKFWLGTLAMALAFSFVLASCATFSSVGGTADAHGLFSSAKAVFDGYETIASYGVILGLVDTGYEGYVAAVKQAESSGKAVTSVTTQYFVYTKVTAYAK